MFRSSPSRPFKLFLFFFFTAELGPPGRWYRRRQQRQSEKSITFENPTPRELRSVVNYFAFTLFFFFSHADSLLWGWAQAVWRWLWVGNSHAFFALFFAIVAVHSLLFIWVARNATWAADAAGSPKKKKALARMWADAARSKTGAMETAAAASGSHPSSLLLIRFSFW